jgi:hypothetical protein
LSASEPVVKVHAPAPFAVVVPRTVPPAEIVTVLFASAVPAMVGVSSSVSRPLAIVPSTFRTLSVTAVMTGASGAMMSMVTA